MATPPRRLSNAAPKLDSDESNSSSFRATVNSDAKNLDCDSTEIPADHSQSNSQNFDSVPNDQDSEPNSRDVLAALAYGLELAHHGAMLVEAEGRPQVANKAALAILQKNDGLSLNRTGLIAERASDTRLLHKLLREAISVPETGEPKESPMTLPRRAGNALIVRVLPGPGVQGPAITQGVALLRLYDQDVGLMVDQKALSALYGLTRGEAALATKLVQGRSIEEAAEDLFISAHTARTHLKRIFMKTDTHRQTELVVRMLLTVL